MARSGRGATASGATPVDDLDPAEHADVEQSEPGEHAQVERPDVERQGIDGDWSDNPGRLDQLSKQIIEQLQEDGRRSYAAIARAVGLSEAATRQRVQRLLDSGVIQIAAITDAAAVGFHRQAMIGVNVEGDIQSVADKLSGAGEAEYVVVCAGRFDILVEVVCEDDDNLMRIVDQVRSVPGVRSTETFVYLKLAKENYQWGTR